LWTYKLFILKGEKDFSHIQRFPLAGQRKVEFRIDNNNYSKIVFVVGGADRGGSYQLDIKALLETTPPALITNFQASDNEDSRSTLSWSNPSDRDLAEVIVRRKTSRYPVSHNDGDLVYQNTNPTPGAAVTHTDTGLTNGITYYYAVFSRDRAGNWNDQVVEGKNADTGRPQTAPAIGLLAGTSNPGKVYSYQGGSQWQAISGELGYAVLALIKYNGAIYAGTISEGVGRLYRYDGGTTWTLVCDNLDSQVSSLAVYKGNLYIGTSWNGGRLYRFDGPGNCPRVVDHRDPGGWSGFRSAYVWGDYLYLGDIGFDIIGRFDGATFEHIVYLGGSCIYDFALYNGELYAGAWTGRLYKSSDGLNWTRVLEGEGSHLWELEAFRGYLFMGFNSGALQRFDGTSRETIWTAPDSIISMVAQGDSRLYIGTGGEAGYLGRTSGDGRVYAYDGITVTPISEYLGAGVQVLYLAPEGSGVSVNAVKVKPQSLRAFAFQRDQLIEFRVEGWDIGWMRVSVFDLSGKLVFRSDWVQNGFTWNLLDSRGQPLANGVYLYVVRVRGFDGQEYVSEVRKLVILR
jgi:hypothetical protein